MYVYGAVGGVSVLEAYLSLESEEGKGPSLMWTCLIHSVEEMEKTQGLGIRGSTCHRLLELSQPLPASLELETWLLLGLEAAGLPHGLSWLAGPWTVAGAAPSALLTAEHGTPLPP